MRNPLLLAVVATITLCGEVYPQTLTMDQYLAIVKQRHPFMVKEAMQTDIEALRRDRLLGDEDWVLRSSPAFSYQKPIVSSTFSPERIYSVNVGATAERAFWGNGGRLSLSWESDYLDQEIPAIQIPTPTGFIDVPIAPSQFYENRLFVTYSYPLLQNRGGILDRLDYELSGFNVDFSEIQALENQENFLLDVGTRFVDWVLILEQTRIAEERLRFQEEQLDQTKRKRRANLVDEVDVLRGEDAVQSSKENLVFNQSRLKAKQAELAVIAQDEGIYSMNPDMDVYALQSLPPIEEIVDRIPGQRIIRALRVRVAQLEEQERGLRNVTRPQLFLSFRGGVQEGDVELVDSWALDRPDVSVALDFRYPLGSRAATADVEQTSLQIRRLEKEIESVSLGLEAQLRSIWIQITELEKVLALSRDQIETARRKTEEERRIYNQGRGDLTFVIQSRDSEALAELTYAVNAASYQKLVLNYRALVDELLPVE